MGSTSLKKLHNESGKGRVIICVLILTLLIIAFLATLRLNLTKQTGQRKIKFSFAYQDRVADAASIIAVEKGFFREQGLSVVPRMFSSGPECMEALISGNADLATMGDATAIIVSSKKADSFKILCTLGGGENRHRIIVSNHSRIKSVSDLEGKRIGIKKGTSTHGGLMQFAERHDIDINDELVDMCPSLQLIALAAGELDVIVASEPTPSQAEAAGYGHALATLGGLDNSYPVLLMVNSNFAKQNPEIVIRVIRAITHARNFIKEHMDEAADIQSRIISIDVKVIKKAMGFHYYDVTLNKQIIDSLKSTSIFLKRIGRIRQVPDFKQVIDQSYLRRSHESLK